MSFIKKLNRALRTMFEQATPTKTPKAPPRRKPAEPEVPIEPVKPRPFNPPKPKKDPKPKAKGPFNPAKPAYHPADEEEDEIVEDVQSVCAIMEAYEDEVHPNIQNFWQDQGEHKFAQHPLFSKHGNTLARAAYQYTSDRSQQVGVTAQDLMNLFFEIVSIEQEHKEELEELAKALISKVWGIDQSKLRAELTGMDQVQSMLEPPEEDDSGGGEDYVDESLQGQVNKRITLNTMTQGAAVHQMMTIHHLVDREIQRISPRLLELYNKISVGSTHQYWLIDFAALVSMLLNMAVGASMVDWEEDEENETEAIVKAKAVCFPVLVQELAKGVMELLTAHGLSDLDMYTSEQVIRQADKMEYEPYLIQVGPELWRRFLRAVPKDVELVDLMAAFSRIEPEQVHHIVDLVVDNPHEANPLLAKLVARPEEAAVEAEKVDALTDFEDQETLFYPEEWEEKGDEYA